MSLPLALEAMHPSSRRWAMSDGVQACHVRVTHGACGKHDTLVESIRAVTHEKGCHAFIARADFFRTTFRCSCSAGGLERCVSLAMCSLSTCYVCQRLSKVSTFSFALSEQLSRIRCASVQSGHFRSSEDRDAICLESMTWSGTPTGLCKLFPGSLPLLSLVLPAAASECPPGPRLKVLLL